MDVALKFPTRSCSRCKHKPCFIGQEFTECDFAKYGCIMYKYKYTRKKSSGK